MEWQVTVIHRVGREGLNDILKNEKELIMTNIQGQKEGKNWQTLNSEQEQGEGEDPQP